KELLYISSSPARHQGKSRVEESGKWEEENMPEGKIAGGGVGQIAWRKSHGRGSREENMPEGQRIPTTKKNVCRLSEDQDARKHVGE
ncbi:hypothetical protein KI387_033936, partial [Taxus chinensis]